MITGQIITSGKVNDINTFEEPNTILTAVYNSARKEGNQLVLELPLKSVVMIDVR
jgi:alpha-N-arabinofuranosidase